MTENINKIVKKVCSAFDITEDDMRRKSRRRDLVYARMICAKYIDSCCNVTSSEIGKYVNRDSSTVRYYLSLFENEYLYNKQFRTFADKVGNVTLEINSGFQRELEQELDEIIVYYGF